MGDDQNKDLIKANSGVPSQINISHSSVLDLSGLSQEQQHTLLMEYNKGMVDIALKAHELNIDTEILKKTLNNLSETAADVSKSGNAVTMTHTQDTKIGRTEIMIGNTEQAQKGKFSKSQTGEKNWTPYYIFAAIAALILIFALIK